MTTHLLSNEERRALLQWPKGCVDCVLDTDTYNEIDDQFAMVHALLSPDKLNVQAIYAAPFHNVRSNGPADGMQKSHEEIQRLLGLLGKPPSLAYRGSERWLDESGDSAPSEARDDLIERARKQPDDRPLYIIAIGAITNVVSAINAAPDICQKIIVLWLGGQPLYWHSAHEFNLAGDLIASQSLFNSGVPLVLFPCSLVAEALRTTLAELEKHMRHQGKVADYLYSIFREFQDHDLSRPGASKVIWDLAPVAWLLDQDMVATTLVPNPILKSSYEWSSEPGKHIIRLAQRLYRDRVFADLFTKLAAGDHAISSKSQ